MFIISKTWHELLKNELDSAEFKQFSLWLNEEYNNKNIYPKPEYVFNAINHVLPQDVKVVILGQDPYHQPNQAHGLSFSVMEGVKLPPSLKNIFKELVNQCNCQLPTNGNLTSWAKQGVLLLNTVLTVEESKPNSHKGKGWERVTNKIISILNERENPVIFMLWGGNAKSFIPLINTNKHFVLTSSHPSPMSANQGGWFGNNHFIKANEILQSLGKSPINWCL